MAIEGYLYTHNKRAVSGWVYEAGDPDRPIELEIVANGSVVDVIRADIYQDHLERAGKGNGKHGFEYVLPNSRIARGRLQARPVGKKWFLQHQEKGVPPEYSMLRHPTLYGLPQPDNGFSEVPPVTDARAEVKLTERLLKAFYYTAKKNRNISRPDDIWTTLENSVFADFYAIVRKRDAQALANYMREMFALGITHGTYQGHLATATLRISKQVRVIPAAAAVDYLASLAEFVGALRVEIAEQHGVYGENLFRDPDDLAQLIRAVTGVPVETPNVAGHKFGLKTRDGFINPSDIRAYYAAVRLQQLLHGIDKPRVCEIGGGIGTTAYYCHRFGIRDYTIIDLPALSLVQGYYLIRALPGERIILAGERDWGGPAIRILPTWAFGKRKFSILYNQDSFPEMHLEHSVAYLSKAKKLTTLLLSINQESGAIQSLTSVQPSVPEIVAKAGGWRRVHRFPHWIRSGYVEELYEVTESGAVLDRVRKLFG